MKTSRFKERLELDEELLCFNGNTLLERVKVISIDKKAKTATLSNRVIVSRHPNEDGAFDKQGSNFKNYTIRRVDEDSEILLKAYQARYNLTAYMQKVIRLANETRNILTASREDIELIIKLDSKLGKLLKDREE